MNILFVEHRDDIAKRLGRMLTDRGHAVFRAGSVEEAREICEVVRVELVVAELELPDGEAGELFESGGACRGVPGIAVVGEGAAGEERARGAGFGAVLGASFGERELDEAIGRVVGRGGKC